MKISRRSVLRYSGLTAALLALESRCTDLRALACPDPGRPGADTRAVPLML